MKSLGLAAMFGAFGLLTACATQESAPVSANAIIMPASSGDTAIASKNIVMTGKSTASAPAASSKSEAGKFAADDIICKRKVVTGSRFAKRVCLSRAEWKGLQDLAKKTTDDFQSRGGRTNQPRSN